MGLFAFLAVCVAVSISLMLRRVGVASTHTVQVLDCQYEGVAAHRHGPECYDEYGLLVCPLPERALHAHDESCYDESGNLICGMEEVLEEHTHGPGCFYTLEVENDTDEQTISYVDDYDAGNVDAEAADAEAIMPEQTFTQEFVDAHDNVVFAVRVDAPEGALPENSVLQASQVTKDELTEKELAAVKQVVATQTEGKVTELEAVNISFVDQDGGEVKPARELTVTLTSPLIDTDDQPYVVHVDDLTQDQVQAMVEGAEEPERTADVVHPLSDEDLGRLDMQLGDDQLAFESGTLPTYVLTVTTKDKVLEASDGASYAVTVNAPASAGVSQEAELQVREFSKDGKHWAKYVPQIEEALGARHNYIRLFELSIVNNGQEVQPTGSVQVQMQLDDADRLNDDVHVVHFDEAGLEVLDTSLGDSTVSFDTTGFSFYAVVGSTIEQDVLTADGRAYRVSLTYGPEAQIPDDARLAVSELEGDSYNDYLGRTKAAMEAADFAYARIFDISLVDAQGAELQPAASVEVSVELLDAGSTDEAFTVVHFAGEDEHLEQMTSETEGNTVSFSTIGFSAYAVVQGPSATPLDWNRLTSMQDLIDNMADGIYIGHVDGYYLSDVEDVATNNAHGIQKTKPAEPFPPDSAARYFFEAVEGATNQYYLYCLKDGEKHYIQNNNNEHIYLTTDTTARTAFEVTAETNNRFSFRSLDTNRYLNNWQDANGKVFACWTAKNAGGYFYLWQHDDTMTGDHYGLDGKTYGLIHWNGGATGKAMMGDSSTANSLDGLSLTVMAKAGANDDKLFVPDDSDISMWTFHWVDNDNYYLTTVVDGVTKYLRIQNNSLTMVDNPDNNCKIKVVPGTGTHAGEICLKVGNTTLTYNGSETTGPIFKTGGSAGTEWLRLAEVSELTSDYFMTYSASKVSVSDPSVVDGSRIIVYTRVWNEDTKRYDFYAIDHDGTLVRCYESGDSIEWVGSRLNSLLWNFVEYYWEGTEDPNFYYELYNQYSENYIAPQVTDGQTLSDSTIGINLNGRRNGAYYSTILAWDDDNYAYAGLKADVENGHIVSCPKSEAMDFYFAIMQDIPVDDTLTTVKTVDSVQHGITIKMVDFNKAYFGVNDENNAVKNAMTAFLGSTGRYREGPYPEQGLLSTALGDDGYPTTVNGGNSLSDWFTGANVREVNHLFIESTYDATGYYEYDSTQNFASLQANNDFKVYKEIGAFNNQSGKFHSHGQFMPYNDIQAGVFASANPKNLTDAQGRTLPESDPRKYEQLYNIQNPNYYNGVELEASFTQTPSGLDDWGHDIIYEFTGDDDFWLYVDGELVIDLGGIHDALPGTVNFRTGKVVVNGVETTLKDIFYNNYKGRGHTDAEAAAYVDELFELNDDNQWVFKDYTTHTMRIFYLERGAGASNLHMRFNLASVKPGTVQLTKKLSGVDMKESILAEFPYQIKYKREGSDTEYFLANATHTSAQQENYVFYKGTPTPVTYMDSLNVGGVTYSNVFLLKPDEVAEVNFPEGVTTYSIVECGVDTDVYESVSANDVELTGTSGSGYAQNRKDYALDEATTDERARVVYDNEVSHDALRSIELKKILYKEDGVTEITTDEDSTTFSLRLYLATEFEEYLDDAVANMHTYHVKDEHGNYCKWDTASRKLVPIRDGATNYDDLTDAEKASSTFTTSTNGAISRIPTGYTVELREVLAGTRFKVVERPTEMPDGYSFQKYVYESVDYIGPDSDAVAWEGVSDTVDSGETPHVDICNLKGYGLRVNKTWSDADYMADRRPTYFAVYTKDGDDNLTLVPNTARELSYAENTLYWYFLPLPVAVPFDNYEIREVKVTNPVVDSQGYVTSYDSLTPIEDEGPLFIHGRQKGESVDSEFEYTVLYDRGDIDEESNVRVDEVTNNRPGIVIRKEDWEGNPLPGVNFTLADHEGDTIGTFTSNDQGEVTVAFLRDDIDYTLTETKTPQGYHAPEAPLTLRLSNGQVSVSGVDEDYYDIEQGGGSTPTITVKNRPFVLRVVKVGEQPDGTYEPLADAHFELHREVTIDSVTSMELSPLAGFEDLVSQADGLIATVDQTLQPRTYYLKEQDTGVPAGYQALRNPIRFTLSDTGVVTLTSTTEAELTSDVSSGVDGTLTYTLAVKNRPAGVPVRVVKIDQTGAALEGATFNLTSAGISETGLVSQKPAGGNEAIIYEHAMLPLGTYTFTETNPPAGYLPPTENVVITVASSATGIRVTATGVDNNHVRFDPATGVWTVEIMNTTGVELPAAGGTGAAPMVVAGAAMMLAAGAYLLITRRRTAR